MPNAANVVIGESGVQTGDITWADNYVYAPGATVGLRLNTSGNLSMNGSLMPSSASDHLQRTLSGGTVSVGGSLSSASGNFFATGTSFINT